MDMITLAMAKVYSDKKGGYEESQSITWDGNTNGLTSTTVELAGMTLYRVSDKLIPPGEAKITMAKGNTIPGTPTEAIPGFVVLAELLAFSAKAGEYGVGEDIIVVPESGTYFAKLGNVYATAVSWETIHPIDPKFLPGVCLPVVELSTVLEFKADTPLTAEEGAMLDKMAAQSMPIICKCVLSAYGVAQSMTVVMDWAGADSMSMFTAMTSSGLIVGISNESGSWTAQAVQIGA